MYNTELDLDNQISNPACEDLIVFEIFCPNEPCTHHGNPS